MIIILVIYYVLLILCLPLICRTPDADLIADDTTPPEKLKLDPEKVRGSSGLSCYKQD